ncbi:MAG: hypothetical protein JXQ73_23420 [Phycisphaerae bacterium]|nr:hypothetical protein [Phycisphaerae bacterium]
MRRFRQVSLCLVGFVLAALCMAAGKAGDPSASTRPAVRGPWPPKPVVEATLKRMVKDVAKQLKMDAKQTAVLSEQAMSRWPAFLEKHRPVLQPLVNEYIEALIIGDPPKPETVARWAKAFQPIIEKAAQEFEGTYLEVRKVLRPDQLQQWDEGQKSFRAGKQTMEQQVRELASGRFDPRTWQTPFPKPRGSGPAPIRVATPAADGARVNAAAPGDRPRQRGNRFSSRRGAAPGPSRLGQTDPARRGGVIVADQKVRPLDKWESFVKDFIKRHGLDEAQTNSAMAILEELKTQAEDYETRHRGEMAKLERAVQAADPEVKPRYQGQLDDLRRPVADLFQELQDRLDGLLTASQRQGTRK